MVFRGFQVILGIFRVIFLFRIVFVLCDCITFVTKNAKYLCTISQGLGFLGFQGFFRVFLGFLQILLFKVEKPPFCTVLRLIVNFSLFCFARGVGLCTEPRKSLCLLFSQGLGFQGLDFLGFYGFQGFLGYFRVFQGYFLFRIVFVLCDCITFVTKNAKYLCTISQFKFFFEGFFLQGRCASPVEQGFVPNHVVFLIFLGFRVLVQILQGFMVFRVFQVILGFFRVIFLFRLCLFFVIALLLHQVFLGFFQGFCRYFCLRWRNHHSVRFSV